jgi:hypothetical protein
LLLALALAGGVRAAHAFEMLADPTRPVDAVAGGSGAGVGYGGPVLHSTLVSPYRKLAVIDGGTYGVGDRVAGGVISEIRPYEVVLRTGGREVHLRLIPRLNKGAAVAKSPDKIEHKSKDQAEVGNE